VTRTEDHGSLRRVAVLGSIHSNYLALCEALHLVRARRVEAVYALGDFGGFGPHPDRTIERLRVARVRCVKGSYEEWLSSDGAFHADGADAGDDHYAQVSYEYTRDGTSPEHKAWMGSLPGRVRVRVGASRLLLCHGSPRRAGDSLWRSTTREPIVRALLAEHEADLVVCGRTGIHWQRLVEPGRGVLNAGSVGRPPNDGATHVWCAVVEEREGTLVAEHLPVAYDHERLAREMADEQLPDAFAETVRTGWWTTGLGALPAEERRAGKY
jgi:diadenosine tetraphosphatase ApaH/serine/threonine PP2A family protein phosphatase